MCRRSYGKSVAHSNVCSATSGYKNPTFRGQFSNQPKSELLLTSYVLRPCLRLCSARLSCQPPQDCPQRGSSHAGACSQCVQATVQAQGSMLPTLFNRQPGSLPSSRSNSRALPASSDLNLVAVLLEPKRFEEVMALSSGTLTPNR